MHNLHHSSSFLNYHGQLQPMHHPHALQGSSAGGHGMLQGILMGVTHNAQQHASVAHNISLGNAGNSAAVQHSQSLLAHAQQQLAFSGDGVGLMNGMGGLSLGNTNANAIGVGNLNPLGGSMGSHSSFPSNVRPQPHGKVPQPTAVPRSEDCIRDVWAHNLEEEMKKISDIVDRYPFISMDTEFPGVVVHPLGNYVGSNFSHMWKTIQCNVNILKIIQLGLTFSDEHGRVPDGVCTWQFNFKFDIDLDMYAQDSIELLQASGLDFGKHNSDGIDVHSFGELLTASGLVLNEEVRWVSFHSGYDFGYIIRVLTNAELPEDESEFFELLDMYFNCVYDIKYVMKSCSELNHKSGLNQLALDLSIDRIGPCHQAGSDSLITCMTFFKMIKNHAPDFSLNDAKWKNVLYGLGRDNL